MAFSNEQLERYSRHIILKEVGAKGQKKLLNAKVLIIGAGGLLGILLAAAVVIIVYLTNDTVKTPEDVEKYLGLSVLGTIPYSSKMGKKSKKKKKRHA